jgi:hypothetical protein
MIDFSNKDYQDILQRIQRAKAYVEDWRTNVTRWRRLYNLKHYGGVPKDREIQYSDPTYTNTVDLAVGIMLANQLRWHAFGFHPSHKEQADTGKIEKLLEGTLSVNDEREETLHDYQLFQNFVRDGGGVIYSVIDPDIFKSAQSKVTDYDEQAQPIEKIAFSEVPIRIQVVDPLKFFALPGGPKRWLVMGREETMTILDVELTYGVKINKYSYMSDEMKSQTNGTFMDVWDWVRVEMPKADGSGVTNELIARNTIIFDNEAILGPRLMEGYSDLPYTFQFFKPTEDNAAGWQSIISPLESSVSLMERTFNRRAYQIDVFTSLPLITKTQPGRKVQVDSGLYNTIALSPDESMEFPRWPGNPPEVQLHLDFLRSRVQQSGFSDVMFGSGANQVAGYALSQLGDQNRIRLEQPIKHIQLLLTTWAKKTLRLLKYFTSGATICVYGTHRGKDYVDYVEMSEMDGYSVRAEIRPNFPNEEQRKVAMATQVKGIVSNYTIMEKYLGIEQPEDEEERRLIEAVTNHPASANYMIMKELKKRADQGDEIAAMTLQAMQSGGLAGAPGRPNEPPNPAQLTGTQSPTGQPVPQALGQVPGQSPEDIQAGLAESPQLMGG